MIDDDDDRALDDLVDRRPPADEAARQARAPYQQLLDGMDALDRAPPPAGWEDRVDARLREAQARERRRRRRWLAAGGGVALAAAATLVVIATRAPGGVAPPTLAVEIPAGSRAVMRGSGAEMLAVGDTRDLRLDSRDRARALRVYRESRLVAQCPGDAGCRFDADAVHLTFRFTEPGTYRLVGLAGRAVPPSGGTFDGDMQVVREQHLDAPMETRVVH